MNITTLGVSGLPNELICPLEQLAMLRVPSTHCWAPVISSCGFWNVCFQLSGMDWGLCVGLPVEVMAVPAMEFGPLYLVQLEAGAGSCGTVVLTSHCCVGK